MTRSDMKKMIYPSIHSSFAAQMKNTRGERNGVEIHSPNASKNTHSPFVPSVLRKQKVSRDENDNVSITKLKKLFLAFCFLTQLTHGAATSSLQPVLQPYKTALTDLIAAHRQLTPKKPIVLSPGSPIFATYQKLITPYVAYIAGYSQIVASEVARNFPFYKDLTILTKQYNSYAQEVGAIVALLPKDVQPQALEIFYQSLTDSVVQTCYNIVQQSAYAQDLSDQLLAGVFQAYQLAWAAQTTTMKLIGAGSSSDFQTNTTQSMQILFNAAIQQAQSQLSQGMSSGAQLEVLYKKLEQYYQVLYQVYTNSGDTTNAIAQQNLMSAVQQQKSAYQQAQAQQTQAEQAALAARTVIVLDVNNAATVAQNIATSNQNFSNAVTFYQAAAGLYGQAQDLVGQNICNQQQSLINDFDLLVRMVQQLWALYLVDQSSSNELESYPALSAFVAGTGTIDNAVASLQNMIGLCDPQSSYSNAIGALQSTSQNLVISSVLTDTINSVKTVLLTQSMSAQTAETSVNVKFLTDLKILQDAQNGLTMLNSFSNTLLSVVNDYQNSQAYATSIAQAMAYGKQLDHLFGSQKNLDQYIPNLPNGLSSNKTWINFCIQFLLQLGVTAQAITQAGSTTVVQPEAPSVQDIARWQTKAMLLRQQAKAMETAGDFATASASYQKAMQAYQAVAQLEPDALKQIEMLAKAEQMYTLFAACSFASIPKQVGLVSLGKFLKIPISYRATEYQLSFNPTLMGGALPNFLSSATEGQAITTFSKSQQQEIFALVKAYLVAQLLSDKGYSFTDYFTDYRMATMLTPSHTVQSYVDQISTYVNNFDNVGLSSATVDSTTAVTILLANLPLTLVTPICSTMSSAAIYYSSASMLFAPGTSFVTLGGQSYHPGDDADSANLMLQNLGYVYGSAAQEQMAQVTALMQQLSKQLGLSAKGATAQILPQDFSQSLRTVKNLCIQVQALLYQPITSSAYSCFVQAGATDLASTVMQQFLQLYQTQIDFMQSCLIGDPTTNDYQTLVGSINQLYVNWASQLDPVKDATQIATINSKIAQLYEFAGNQSLKFTYTKAAFPGVLQVHFMTAAQYFRSAQLQYQSLKNSTKVQALSVLLNQMYYQACQQNLKLYLKVRESGIYYNSVTNPGQVVQVSLAAMVQDMANGSFVDSGQQDAFNIVQNLLLDASMVYEHLSGTPTATPVKHSNQQQIIEFLQHHNVISDQINSVALIPLMQAGMVTKLIDLITPAYTQFITQPATFAAWNNLLFLVVKTLYIMDFLSATSTQTAALLATQTEQFLTAIQKEGSSLQNPSAAYIQ